MTNKELLAKVKFKPDTDRYIILKHILDVGYIYNHEIRNANLPKPILSHTKVTSDIREEIQPFKLNLVCRQVFAPDGEGDLKATGTYRNTIESVGS